MLSSTLSSCPLQYYSLSLYVHTRRTVVESGESDQAAVPQDAISKILAIQSPRDLPYASGSRLSKSHSRLATSPIGAQIPGTA